MIFFDYSLKIHSFEIVTLNHSCEFPPAWSMMILYMNFEKTARYADDFPVKCVQDIHDLKGSLALGQATRRFDTDFLSIRKTHQKLDDYS